MPKSPEFASLNSVEYLYLQQISETRDNSLRIVVQEAVANRLGTVRPESEVLELSSLRTDTWPIETTEGCRTFELSWNRYVAYLVTEEMVGSCGGYEDEKHSGKLFRVYTKSHFLDHLGRDTGAHTEPIRHFKLTCLNHLIDIASYEVPSIRIVEGTPEKPPRIQ
jgi:hypothetical protein